MPTELYPHQKKAVEELRNGNVLVGGVGSGKTRTALVYFYTKVAKGGLQVNDIGLDTDPKNPIDIYVITTARKRDEFDWQVEAAGIGLSEDRALSKGGIKLTVDSYNNIKKYKDIKDAFFIFDEQRLVGSGVWVESFLKIAKGNSWILLSATPGDNWMDYMPLFVANGFYKNKTEFVREHVIFDRFAKYPKIDRYIATGRLRKLRKTILVDMPFARRTLRNIKYMKVEHRADLYEQVFKDRWDIFEGQPIQQASQSVLLQRKVVNLDSSRLDLVRDILAEKDRVIIFYNFNYELEILRSLKDIPGVRLAEWNGHKHEPVPDGQKWIYLVQYAAGNEAWNCITTNTIIFYSMQYSYRVFEQCLGRIDRLNTPYKDLYYYIFYSDTPIDRALRATIEKKKDFNEKAFMKGKFD